MGPAGPTPSLMQAERDGQHGSAWPKNTQVSPSKSPTMCRALRDWGKSPGVVPTWPELVEGEMDLIPNLNNRNSGESCRRAYMPGTFYTQPHWSLT